MKWKAVSRRTRVLGAFAILSAVASVWTAVLAHRNPCATAVSLFPADRPNQFRYAIADSRTPRLRLVQDSDSDDGGGDEPPESVLVRPQEGTEANGVPCANTMETHSILRGFAFSAFAVFSLGTFLSYQRDKRRYRKKLIGRARRDEFRRRRDTAAQSAPTSVPMRGKPGPAAVCACGCGEGVAPGEQFVPGHAQMMRLELEQKAGGLLALRDLVEHRSNSSDDADR